MAAGGRAFERPHRSVAPRLMQGIHSQAPGRFPAKAGRADEGSAAGYARGRKVKRWGQPSGGGYGN